jgi:hypothetical protein
MIVVRLARMAASLMLAVHLVAAVAADAIKLAVLGPNILSFVKAGGPGVRCDEEKTGYGRTDAFIDARDTVPPVRCRMQRPAN